MTFWLALIFLDVISTIFSLNIGISYYALFNFLTTILIFNLFSTYYPDKLNRLLRLSVVVSCLYSFIFLANKLGILPLTVKPFGDNFILQVWGHSNLANYLIFPFIYLIYSIKRQNHRLVALPLLLFLTVLSLSFSRTSILAIIVGLIFFKPTNFPQQLIKKIFFIFSVFILGFLFYYSASTNSHYKDLLGSRPGYWLQGIDGFSRSPLFGNGAETFNVINRQSLKPGQIGGNTAHNSILDYLYNNGLILTALNYQRKNNSLTFSLGIASFTCSMFDPSWAFPGILVISLIIIFYDFPIFFSLNPNLKTKVFLAFLSITIFIFFCLKTTSDFLYFYHHYDLSLKFDPFNLNSRLATIDQNTPSTLKLFQNESLVYQKLIDTTPLPASEPYYLKLFELDPQNSTDSAMKLANYYLSSNSPKFIPFVSKLLENNPHVTHIQLSYLLNRLALKYWQDKQFNKAIYYYHQAVGISPDWGPMYVELANAYWYLGQINNAEQILLTCQNFPAPRLECSQYFQSDSYSTHPPGSYPIPPQ